MEGPTPLPRSLPVRSVGPDKYGEERHKGLDCGVTCGERVGSSFLFLARARHTHSPIDVIVGKYIPRRMALHLSNPELRASNRCAKLPAGNDLGAAGTPSRLSPSQNTTIPQDNDHMGFQTQGISWSVPARPSVSIAPKLAEKEKGKEAHSTCRARKSCQAKASPRRFKAHGHRRGRPFA